MRKGISFAALILVLLPASLFTLGCGQSTEPPPPQTVVKEVKPPTVDVLKVDSLDFRSSPKVTDKELSQLRTNPHLRHLNLDNCPVTNEGMKELAALSGLLTLSLSSTQVTDAGLAALEPLTALEDLRLDRLRISDAGLKHLTAFPKLRKLSLWRTLVTDAGLEHLKDLTSLERLSLDETRVTEEGLAHLYGLSNLKYLSIWKTKVSDQGVMEVKKALPRTKVNR